MLGMSKLNSKINIFGGHNMKNFMRLFTCMIATSILASCGMEAKEETPIVTTPETTATITTVLIPSTTTKEFITTTSALEKEEKVITTFDIDVAQTDISKDTTPAIEKDAESKECNEKDLFNICGTITNSVNMRSTPNIKSDENIIKVLSPGTKVIVTNTNIQDGFVKIHLGRENGYIVSDYLEISKVELFAIKDTSINDNIIKCGESIILYEGEANTFYDENYNLVSLEINDFLDKTEFLKTKLNSAKKELVTSFYTYYSHEEKYATKGYNINLCCTEVTTIIPSGKNFNWFEVVGNTGKEEGYQLANTFSGGKVVKGYGGGVCQVASTIYNCVLNLNMKVIERHPHGMAVSYVDWYNGKDATVGDIGGPNLIFKNDLGYDLYINAYTEEIPENDITTRGKLTVEFYKLTW